MSETKEEILQKLRDIRTKQLVDVTDEDLEYLKNIPDDYVLRASQSMDMFAVVESNRRLKNALHKEEWAIKRFTVVLVILTLVLVALGLVPLWDRVAGLLH